MQSQIFPNPSYAPMVHRSYSTSVPYNSLLSPPRRDRSRSPQYLPRPNWMTNGTNPNITTDEMKKILESTNANMYPNGFAELLKNEDRHIKAFKLQINKEKDRLDEDLTSFKVQINHTLEDLRLSLHAHLDRVYQTYLEKVAKFKGELFETHRLKEQLEIQLGASLPTGIFTHVKPDKQKTSNLQKNAEADFDTLVHNGLIGNKNNNVDLKMQTLQTISSMEAGNKEFKKYSIINYISQLQRERAIPLSDLQKDIVFLNSYQNGFYQSKQFLRVLSQMRDHLTEETKKIYDSSYLYIRDIESLLYKQREEGNKILDGLDLNNPTNASNLGPVPTNFNFLSQPQNMARSSGTNIYGTISPSQQSLKVQRAQNIKITQQYSGIQVPSNIGSQTALCGIFINNQIAVGLKGGIIQVLSCDGHNIATLKEHKANICSLAVIRSKNQNYLASGSDVGCSRVVIWDSINWLPKYVLNAHSAAVTGIIDLQDDSYFLSGGYDSKINVYNFEQAKMVFSTQAECPIITMLTNKTGSKLVGSGLDKALYVWQIVRDFSFRTENLVLQRKIQNNSTISAVVASQIVPQLVVISTKDGKIKLVNIERGESYKTVTLQNQVQSSLRPASPLEICIIERENKANYPLVIVWPYKQNKVYVANTETSSIRVKGLNSGGCVLQYGYGVSPKCFFLSDSWKGTLIYSIDQKPGNTGNNCISVYKIEEMRPA